MRQFIAVGQVHALADCVGQGRTQVDFVGQVGVRLCSLVDC